MIFRILNIICFFSFNIFTTGTSNIVTKSNLEKNAQYFKHAESPNANREADFCHKCIRYCLRRHNFVRSCKNFRCYCFPQFDEGG